MKLHIGCGTVYLKGYINIDGAEDQVPGECPSELLERNSTTFDQYYKRDFNVSTDCVEVVADLKHDLRQPLPFPDGSVEEIVMYQVLEHLPQYNVGRLLDDINRVLSNGCVFIVSVPDVKGMAKLLVEAQTDEDEDLAIRFIHGTQRNEWSHHFCGYVPRTLMALLVKHGFGHFEQMPNINCYPVVHLKALKEKGNV